MRESGHHLATTISSGASIPVPGRSEAAHMNLPALAGGTGHPEIARMPGEAEVAAEAEIRLLVFRSELDGRWVCQCVMHGIEKASHATQVKAPIPTT